MEITIQYSAAALLELRSLPIYDELLAIENQFELHAFDLKMGCCMTNDALREMKEFVHDIETIFESANLSEILAVNITKNQLLLIKAMKENVNFPQI